MGKLSFDALIEDLYDPRPFATYILELKVTTQKQNKTKQTVIQKCTFSTYLTLPSLHSFWDPTPHLELKFPSISFPFAYLKIRAPQQPWIFCLHKGTEVAQGPTSRPTRRSGDEKRVSVGKMLTTNFYWNLGVYLHTYMYTYHYFICVSIYYMYIYYIHNNINV